MREDHERMRHPLPDEPGDVDDSGEVEELDDRSPADELIDDLIPPELDWRGVVRRHPIPALLVAAAAGYWLGRSRRGAALVEALAGAVAAGVVARVGDLGGLGDLAGLDDEA